MTVCGAEASDEMVLERPDGAFSSVAAMDAGRGELEIDSRGSDERFEEVAGSVVKALEFGLEAAGDKDREHGLVAKLGDVPPPFCCEEVRQGLRCCHSRRGP